MIQGPITVTFVMSACEVKLATSLLMASCLVNRVCRLLFCNSNSFACDFRPMSILLPEVDNILMSLSILDNCFTCVSSFCKAA